MTLTFQQVMNQHMQSLPGRAPIIIYLYLGFCFLGVRNIKVEMCLSPYDC